MQSFSLVSQFAGLPLNHYLSQPTIMRTSFFKLYVGSLIMEKIGSTKTQFLTISCMISYLAYCWFHGCTHLSLKKEIQLLYYSIAICRESLVWPFMVFFFDSRFISKRIFCDHFQSHSPTFSKPSSHVRFPVGRVIDHLLIGFQHVSLCSFHKSILERREELLCIFRYPYFYFFKKNYHILYFFSQIIIWRKHIREHRRVAVVLLF